MFLSVVVPYTRWYRAALAVGLAAVLGTGCSSKSGEEAACPEGVVAIVGLAEWSSLEGAMGSVNPGDDIDVQLCPGTFDSRTHMAEPGGGWGRIVLRGHADGTVLDGGLAGSVLDFEGDGTVELRDLTIANGSSDAGGGGYRGRGNQLLILENVVFEGNQAAWDGGAIRMLAEDTGSVVVEDGGGGSVVFSDNHAGGTGGAISLSGDGFASFGPGGWVFDGNSSGGHGGAVSVQSADVVGIFGDFVAEGNQAGGDGGVLHVAGPNATGLTLGRVDAFDNRAGPSGGVIRLDGGSSGDLTLQSGDLQNNSADEGGAISATDGWSLNVAATSFSGNSPDDIRYAGDSFQASDLGTAFVCNPGAGCSGSR